MVPIGTSTNTISAALRQAVDDPGVGSIVLDIDSPGGDVDGIDELASEIYPGAQTEADHCRLQLPMRERGLLLGQSQVSEVVACPSSLTGCIGVYTMHEDDSAMLEAMGIKLELIKFGENKAEGNNRVPLNDSARAHLQELSTLRKRIREGGSARPRCQAGRVQQQIRPGPRFRRENGSKAWPGGQGRDTG